jgi:hypothetical protein
MVFRGNVVRGNIVRGNIVRGNIVRGNIVRGNIVRGNIVRGNIVRGTNIDPFLLCPLKCDFTYIVLVPILQTRAVQTYNITSGLDNIQSNFLKIIILCMYTLARAQINTK